jgi:RNAse (barnase) inhibitor barstar
VSEPFTILLDGAAIETEADFHEEIRQQTGIAWYGGNLDALDDVLASAIPAARGRFRIVGRDADLSMRGEQQRRLLILGCLKEAEERFADRFLGLTMTFAEPWFDEGQDPWLREV